MSKRKRAPALPQEYRNASAYFYSQHHRTASEKEFGIEELEYCKAVKQQFLSSWIPHFDIPETAIVALERPEHHDKWMEHSTALYIIEYWSDEDAMRDFIRRTFSVDVKSLMSRPAPRLNEQFKFGFSNDIVGDSVNYVYNCLNTIAKEWKETKYYYPGTTMTQTSGAGKSRSVFELAKSNRCYVVYYTFMEGLGFPRKSRDAPDLLEASHLDYFITYFGACLAQISHSKALPADIVAQCIEERCDFWKGVTHFMTKDEHVRSLIPNIFRSDPRSFSTWTQQQMEKITKNGCEKTNAPHDHLRLVFVFDEARATLRGKGQVFQSLMEAAACFPEKSGIAVVFIDTASRISNIVPVAKSGPSSKVADKENILFPPIYLLPTMDVYASPIEENLTTLPDMLQHKILYQLGRPLWKTMIDLENCTEYALLFAMKKLVGGRNLVKSTRPVILTTLECLGILRARLPFQVWRTDITSELVANHMAWCTFISNDRRYVDSMAVSEPILADAATQWMSSRKHRQALPILFKYLEMTVNSSVDIGKNGEYVAALVCLFARDAALQICLDKETAIPVATSSKSEPASILHHRMITVEVFFSSLLGQHVTAELMLKNEKFKNLAQGGISFNHFSHVNRTMTREQMMYLMARGAAILCTEMQRGIDIMIPILVPNTRGECVLSRESITYILIQVKNHRHAMSDHQHKTLAEAIQVNRVGLEDTSKPYITINMNIGEQEPFAAVIQTQQDNQVAIVLSGIHQALFPCLNITSKNLDPCDTRLVQEFQQESVDPLEPNEPEILSLSATDFHMKRISCVSEESTCQLVSLLKALLGRSMDPASLYKKNCIERDYVRSICVPFYVDHFIKNRKQRS